MARRAPILYAAVGLALVAASFLTDSPVAGAVIYGGLGLAAAVALWIRAPAAGPGRATAWRLLACGIGLFTIGDTTWNVFDLALKESAPFPSAADAAYLFGYVALAGGIAAFALRERSTEVARAFADGLIVALGVLVVIWQPLIAPYWLDESLPLLSRAVSAAYPVMDLLLVTAFIALLFAGIRQSVSYWLLLGAVALNFFGDVVYSAQTLQGTYVSGTWLDATWMTSYVCLATAALHPAMSTVGDASSKEGDHRGRVWVMGVAAAAGPAGLLLGIIGETQTDRQVVRAGTLAIIILVILRMSGLMRDLGRKVAEVRRQERVAQAAVSEQQKSADELRRNEARFRSLVSNMSDVITLIDPTGSPSYISPPVERVLGYSPDELLGQNGFDFVHRDDLSKVEAILERVLEGETQTVEVRVRHKDGSMRWVEGVLENHLDQPDLNAIVVVFRDVTQSKLLEQQLLQAQKMEAVGQLAGGVAHDFNNILSVIRNYSEFVIEDLPEGDPKREDLEEIQKATHRASDLVRQLLTFSRREIVRRRVLEVNSLIFDLQKLLRRTIPESVDISVNLTATPAYVDADPTQIEQILMNLSVNARDAMLDGGSLEIVTKVHEVGSEFANQRSGLRPGSYVILSVCDTGIGMPPEVRDHVFEPFYTTKERGHGTGLGLATVYGIVDRLGGHIDVRSAPGEGTTMEVYLPSSDQASDVEEEPVRPGRPAGGESILVAEDESAVRNLVERILVREGYRVVVAPSGKHALVIAQGDEPIDMLLTDVVMPEMSGKELAERIEELRPDLPTLFMSGYTGEIVARHGILQEGEALIQKPFDAKELLARVRETLDRDGRGENVVTLERESAVARPS